MRILGIDYGEARVGIAISDELEITAQGLETVTCKGNDKIVLARLDELMKEFKVQTIVVGMPVLMNGDKSTRAKKTEEFIHKLKCKYNKVKIDYIDERLTTVQAYKTMNDLEINKKKKRRISGYSICSIHFRNIYEQEKK